MSTTKIPVSDAIPTGTGKRTRKEKNVSFTYANFNDNTALHILQVLADLTCQQEELEPVKLTLKA